jgi:hypothetical protein
MKKIVREHYPACKLPEDLREGIPEDGFVRVIVEIEATSPHRPLSEILESVKPLRHADIDQVRRVRDVREGERNREELHERIRRGEV